MPVCGDFQRRGRHNSATTAQRVLPVCEWPALGMPLGTARSNAASAVCSRCGGACIVEAAQGWAGGLWGLRFCRCVEISRGGGSTRQPQRTEPCQCVIGQPWACLGALQGKMQPVLYSAGVMDAALLEAAARAGRLFVGVAVLPVCGDFQRRRQHSATTAHRALPAREWPVLGMP